MRSVSVWIFGALITLFPAQGSVAAGDSGEYQTMLVQNEEFNDWFSYLFKPDSKIILLDEREFDFGTGGHPVVDEDRQAMKGNGGGRYFLVMHLAFRIVTSNGQPSFDRLAPDSSVYFYDAQRKCAGSVAFMGSQGLIHNAIWLTEDAFAILGSFNDSGQIELFSMSRGLVVTFDLPKKCRRPDSSIEGYLIRTYYRSELKYRMD